MEIDMRDWTIMVYLGADNNLGQDMIWALKDIHDEQLPDGIGIAALGGPIGTFSARIAATNRSRFALSASSRSMTRRSGPARNA